MPIDPAVGLARSHDPQLPTAANRHVGSTGRESKGTGSALLTDHDTGALEDNP